MGLLCPPNGCGTVRGTVRLATGYDQKYKRRNRRRFLFTAHYRECRVPGIHVHTAEKEGAGLDIRYLKGVGEKTCRPAHQVLGIRTVDDLLGFYPLDYVDYPTPTLLPAPPMT